MVKRNLFLLLFFLAFHSLQAQNVDLAQFQAMSPRNIGPAGMSGRVTCIDVIHDQPEVIYIGTASGGLWKSESGGTAWKSIFDKQPINSIGALAIDQNNSDVIWAGTGEGNPRNSHSSGAGIFKSLDGGRTWKCMGLENTKTIHRIFVHRDDPNTVYVGALGSAWGPNPERGVFKTTDGGTSWEKVLYVNDSTGCADLVIDPTNPNKLIAGMWEHGRKPWTFTSGGKGSGLYITVDGGKTWQKRTDKHGLPKGKLGRMGLAIAPSQPKRVYALVEAKKTGLYRSDDGGFTWKKVADKNIGNRPFYYADIYVDPQNENRIYNLHSVVSVSEDGGKNFSTLIPWSEVHPDHHAWWIHPKDPNFIIEGNDGGMAISRDRAKTWRFVENLPLAQFYHINYDMEIPYNVYGGMQDNGSWRGPSQVWKSGGIKNSEWQELYFGDGFDVVPQRGNSRYGYAMSQGGNVGRYDFVTGANQFVKPVHPKGTHLRFNWNAAIAHSPHDDCTVYFGSQFLHRTTDCGNSWEVISPDLTTNDSTKQKQHLSGGLTIDATQAENFTTIISIAPSPKDKGVIWVGSDDGKLHLTLNGGQEWTELSERLPGAPKGAWIPQIEVSNFSPGEAFVVLNDYRRNNWDPYLYHTRDFGKTWRRLVKKGDVNGHCLSIVQDPVEENLLFLGTEQGLYFSLNGGKEWQRWDKNFPAVPVRDLKIHPREHDLIIGTFGRAAWIMDDIRPLRTLTNSGTELLGKNLVVFPAPDAYMAARKSYTGVRFGAGAHFIGKNKGSRAQFSVWLKDPGSGKGKKDKTDKEDLEEDESKDKKDENEEEKEKTDPRFKNKFRLTILSLDRDTVWDYGIKPDTGLNRIGWGMRQKGVRFPSHKSPKKTDNHPWGMQVLPGKYLVYVGFGKDKDSTQVTVHPDPRVKFDLTAAKMKQGFLKRHEKMTHAAWQAVEDLKTAKKQTKELETLLSHLEEELQDSISKEGKTVRDSVDAIMNLFLRPENEKGYENITQRINNHLYRSSGYISSSMGMVGSNAINSFDHVRGEVERALSRIRNFWKNTWGPYKAKVDSLTVPLLDEFEPVEYKD